MALPIMCHNRSSSFVREIFDTLLCAEVELHPSALVLGIDHREGVTSEAMHMPEGLWNSAVGHDDCDLMECLRKKSPEVPVILSAPQTGAGVALDSMVEVREAVEDRGRKRLEYCFRRCPNFRPRCRTSEQTRGYRAPHRLPRVPQRRSKSARTSGSAFQSSKKSLPWCTL